MKPEILETMLSEDLIDRLKNLYENPGELKSTEIAGLKPHYLSCRTVGQAEKLNAGRLHWRIFGIHTPAEEVRISKALFWPWLLNLRFGKGIQGTVEFQIIALGGAYNYEQISSRSLVITRFR